MRPRLTPEDFRAAFTAPEGWGTFSQKTGAGTLQAGLALRHGRLKLKTLALAGPWTKVTAHREGQAIAASVSSRDGRAVVLFARGLLLQKGQHLTVALS